ncbi:MAG: hypothetical protein MI923_21525 [Phycisphaerales bacterium]|nr:hypothetical protein [Phycisphaerales bacterium]
MADDPPPHVRALSRPGVFFWFSPPAAQPTSFIKGNAVFKHERRGAFFTKVFYGLRDWQ